MKNGVIIKSFQHGISLILDEQAAFDELLSEIAYKFKESSHFFKDAKMILSLEGRTLSAMEETQVIQTIEENSEITIICLIGHDEETNQKIFKALKQYENLTDENQNNGQFYRGTLKDGQVLETESSIIVLGDVNPGSNIISTKDIIIIGGLYGNAYAGGNGEDGHFVIALEMSPEYIKIGKYKYKPPKPSKWSIKPKMQPKIAYVKGDELVVEPITRDYISKLV